MAASTSHAFRNPQPASAWTSPWPCNPQSRRGFSLLDLLITLLVLALVLLAAVKQFGSYEKSAILPTPPAQSAPSQQ